MTLNDDILFFEDEIPSLPDEPDIRSLLLKLQRVTNEEDLRELTPEELAAKYGFSEGELEAISRLPIRFRAPGWRIWRKNAGGYGIHIRHYREEDI